MAVVGWVHRPSPAPHLHGDPEAIIARCPAPRDPEPDAHWVCPECETLWILHDYMRWWRWRRANWWQRWKYWNWIHGQETT